MLTKFIFFALPAVMLFSCKKENMCDCVKSTGNRMATYRNVSNFTCISANDKMDVYLTQGNTYEVRVEAGKNLQSLIKTELDGETLKVFNKNRCNWVRDYNEKINIYITAPQFNHIENNGLGTIQTTAVLTQSTVSCRITSSGDINLTINAYKVSGSSHGNGDLYLSGTTNQFMYDYVGTNYLYLSELTILNYAYLHSVTIGKTFFNAPENGLMDVIIDQDGDIYYKGNPSLIHLTKNGKGDLIKQ